MRRNPPRRSLESWNKLTFAAAARAAAHRRLVDAHRDEWESILNEEREKFALPPIGLREKADA